MNAKRVVRIVAVISALVSLIVVGGAATPSHAATSFTITLDPLIGSNDNTIPTVSFGGKIGYHLFVSNTGDSNTTQASIVVDSDFATFSDASASACAKDPTDATRMVCKLVQMKGGGTFSVDLRFTAPAGGSAVVTTPSLTVDAQTQGDPGNNGTQTTFGDPVTIALVTDAGNSVVKTFARGKESLTTGATLLQHSQFTMPNGLLNGLYGVDTSVQEIPGASSLCADCPAFATQLDIPDSLLVSGSPFSAANFFTFTITLLPDGVPQKYSPVGLYHDGVLVPMCDTSPLSATTHVCLTSLQTKNYKQKGIVAVGKADKNGRFGFG